MNPNLMPAMGPLSFLWPSLLWLLLALPLLVLLYLWLLRRRQPQAVPHSQLDLVRQAMGRGPGWRRHLPPVLLWLALGVLLLAAARPQARISLPSQQQAIVLAMDVSGSMRASDVQPNRLVASQNAAKAFLAELPPQVRVGIVAFAGSAQVVQPLTLSRDDLVAAIDKFQLQRATAIGSAVVVALAELFPDQGIDLDAVAGMGGPGESRNAPGRALGGPAPSQPAPAPVAPGSYGSAAIILLTDGQRTTGVDTGLAAQLAADRGVRVYTVGIGTPEGEVIGFEGWSMRVRLDEPSLRAIASTTQGEYFYAGSADSLRAVYQRLSSRLTLQTQATEVGALLALGAALLLLLSAGLSLWWFRRVF